MADDTSGDTYIKIIRDQTHIDNEVVIIGLLTLLLVLFVVAAVFVANINGGLFYNHKVSIEGRTDALTVAHLCSRSPRTNRNEGDVCKNLVQIVLSDVTLFNWRKKKRKIVMMIPPPVSPRRAVYGCIISICRGGMGELYAFKQ